MLDFGFPPCHFLTTHLILLSLKCSASPTQMHLQSNSSHLWDLTALPSFRLGSLSFFCSYTATSAPFYPNSSLTYIFFLNTNVSFSSLKSS